MVTLLLLFDLAYDMCLQAYLQDNISLLKINQTPAKKTLKYFPKSSTTRVGRLLAVWLC